MFVRINYGRNKGKICEVQIEAARAMLADGRALAAFPEPKPKKKRS